MDDPHAYMVAVIREAHRACDEVDDGVPVVENTINEVEYVLSQIQDTDNQSEFAALMRQFLAQLIPFVRCRRPGRPERDVNINSLKTCLDLDMTVPDMAKFFSVSQRTIKRRMRQNGLSSRGRFSNVTDEQLDVIVHEIKRSDEHCGMSRLQGHLRSKGYRLRREQIRSSMHRVDPGGVEERKLCLRWISRRSYHAKGPNYVWHIDGHHKLIRWGFVTHGGIDGYSRMVTFLKCSNNNRPITVLDAFVEAVNKYGIPSKVRSDKGGENIGVADFMLHFQGERSYITGRSVHNQRIERLWRDVFQDCSLTFYILFYQFEEEGKLDPDNHLHVKILQFCFLRVYNARLTEWMEGWNHHKLRTAGSRTPLQLWMSQFHPTDDQAQLTFGLDDPLPTTVPDLEEFTADVPQNVSDMMTTLHQEILNTTDIVTCTNIYHRILGVLP